MTEDVFRGLGVKIELNTQDDFLRIVETLTRIGVLNSFYFDDKPTKKVLTQSCHILHKKNQYAILHFKELFKLDGNAKSEITEEDIVRRNGIVNLLVEWNLCKIAGDATVEGNIEGTKVIPHRFKDKYILRQKYSIGKDTRNPKKY